jgi:Ca2+-binding EF-hand superfamily protein
MLFIGTQALNRTGRILYTEFLACTLDTNGPLHQQRFLEVFEQIDRSKKGHITKDDLRCILPRSIKGKYPQSLLKGEAANGDGVLSFETFLAGITNDTHS